METSEVLNRAADEIGGRGWWNGSPGKNGRLCASNAIRAVALVEWPHEHQFRERDEPQQAFVSYLGVRGIGGIFEWNDAPERTATEVIETLRAAAVIEEARERATSHPADPTSVAALGGAV